MGLQFVNQVEKLTHKVRNKPIEFLGKE